MWYHSDRHSEANNLNKKMTRGIYLDVDLDGELRLAAARERQSVSRFIQNAVKAAIAAQKRSRSSEEVAA
jgi:hypothetical protein